MQGAVIIGRGQTEAEVDEVLLTGGIAAAHAVHLRHGDVRLVDEHDIVGRKIVKKRVGCRADRPPRQHTGVVLYPRAEADLTQHFKVVFGALLNALCLEKLVLRAEKFHALLHLALDLGKRGLALLIRHGVVRGGENGGIAQPLNDLTRHHVDLA